MSLKIFQVVTHTLIIAIAMLLGPKVTQEDTFHIGKLYCFCPALDHIYDHHERVFYYRKTPWNVPVLENCCAEQSRSRVKLIINR